MGKSKQELIRHAIEKADLKGLQALLRDGASPNDPLDNGLLPLMSAASRNDEQVVQLLLDSGGDPRRKSRLGMTALQYTSSPKIAVLLVAAGAEVNATDDYGGNPLFSVASNGDAEMVKWLLAHGVKDAPAGMEGMTSLHQACLLAYPKVVAALLAGGADANLRSKDGLTPLMYVEGMQGKTGVQIIKLLLAAGADPNAKMADGGFPLYRAATDGSPAAIEALIEGGAKIEMDDGCGETALAAAVYVNKADTAAALLKAGANAKARISPDHEDPNRRGKSVLELAAASRLAAIRTLFKSR